MRHSDSVETAANARLRAIARSKVGTVTPIPLVGSDRTAQILVFALACERGITISLFDREPASTVVSEMIAPLGVRIRIVDTDGST